MYTHTLKDPADRKDFFEKATRIFLFSPIALQAIFLFCYALGKSIPISNALTNFIEFDIFGNTDGRSADFESLEIIMSGSFLLIIQYLLLQAAFRNSKGVQIISRFLIFAGSIFLLRVLVVNILQSISPSNSNDLAISYNSSYVLLFCIPIILILTIVKGAWIYTTRSNSLKLLSLTSRILFIYSLFIVLITVPRVVYSFIVNVW